MTRWIFAPIAAALVLTFSLSDTSANQKPAKPEKEEEKKVLTLEEIMKKGHGKKGFIASIPEFVEAKDWDKAANEAKTLKIFGEGIGLLEPNKGTEESWKMMCDAYKANTAMVATGVEKKDAEMVDKGIAAIKMSCGTCHKAHK